MIEFFNIRDGQRTKLDNPHLIAAYINSSDMHVNAGQGQDFGWRISPVEVARINQLKADPSKLELIAQHLGKPVSEIRQVDFVKYVSHLDDLAARTKAINENDTPAFQAQYEAELKALEGVKVPLPDPSIINADESSVPPAPTTPAEPAAPVKPADVPAPTSKKK